MNNITNDQFQKIIGHCTKVFTQKMTDYGTAWRVLRVSSLTDQIYIKAKRIRSIELKTVKMVDEDVENEFVGIINYCAMAIIQYRKGVDETDLLTKIEVTSLFTSVLHDAYELMNRKNHDYDEAWRNMRVSSLTDIILMKLLRIKQIEDNQGNTLVSEGIDANYFDIINYAIFALILLDFNVLTER